FDSIETQHDAWFCRLAIRADSSDLLKAALIFHLRTNIAIPASHGLHVVRQDYLSRRDHAFQCVPVSLRDGYQRFDGGFRIQLYGLNDGLIPNLRATVLQLIAVD